MRSPFYLNGVKLEMIRQYKYLGFVLTPSGEISTGLHDLRDRAFNPTWCGLFLQSLVWGGANMAPLPYFG